ncbi:MAG TPA: hypothetical protein VKY38_01075, partial [Azoarcus sp.]|nr:hypothetical protein [Azoarcus sp.]
MKIHFSILPTWLRIGCILLGCLSGLVHAQNTPDIDPAPLVIAKPLPPNIMFIMDDSGSMAWQHMPGTAASWSSSEPSGLPGRNIIAHDIRLRASNVNTQLSAGDPQYHIQMTYEGQEPNGSDQTAGFSDAALQYGSGLSNAAPRDVRIYRITARSQAPDTTTNR